MLASFVILTRDRPVELAQTLGALARLSPAAGEIIVVDNGSSPAAEVPARAGAARVRLVRLEGNAGAAGRNAAAEIARGEWLVMLDDDSAPVDAGFVAALEEAAGDVLAIGADIRLPSGAREVGGLPEVVVGCGAAVRAAAYRAIGGYDPGFVYYAEEYDLCARLIALGGRVVHDGRFGVLHRKTERGRDVGRIVRRLVRNEGVVAHRYAPEAELEGVRRAWLARREAVARREGVMASYEAGLADLDEALASEARRPLSSERWARFVGRAAALEGFLRAGLEGERAALVLPPGPPGKNVEEIERALAEAGARQVTPEECRVWVVGTLSPGAAAEAAEVLRRENPGVRVEAPWAVRPPVKSGAGSVRFACNG